MNTLLIAAAVTFALGLAPAMAAEGNSEPFPNSVGGVASSTASAQATADTGSQAFPATAGRPGSDLPSLAGDVLPTDGSEGVIQTANSLPAHFEDGTVAYAQANHVQAWVSAHAARHAPNSYVSIPASAAPRG